VFVELPAEEGLDAVFLVEGELLHELRARIEPRGAGLDLGEVDVVARELYEIARPGERQPVVNDHGAAAHARLARAACLGQGNEVKWRVLEWVRSVVFRAWAR